jgi:hypothetical protein
MSYLCPRCAADPHPPMYGSPRKCAFNEDGSFNPNNWCCATIDLLTDHHTTDTRYGRDECLQTIQVSATYEDDDNVVTVNCESSDGFIVLTRYKTRPTISSASWVGDFWPARPFTLELVERVISCSRL